MLREDATQVLFSQKLAEEQSSRAVLSALQSPPTFGIDGTKHRQLECDIIPSSEPEMQDGQIQVVVG